MLFISWWGGVGVEVELPFISQVGQYIENKYAYEQITLHTDSKDEGTPTDNRNTYYSSVQNFHEDFVRDEY